MRRSLLLVLLSTVPVAGCSSDAGSDWSSVYAMAKNYWNGYPPISLEQAAAVPYASIGVRTGSGPQVLLVLATVGADNDLLWVAGKSVAIETRDGRIVRTSGLAHNLTGSWLISSASESDSRAWIWRRKTVWMADFAERDLYSIRVDCTQSAPIDDPITLLGKTIEVVRVDQSCEAASLNWTFVNQFWIDRSNGFVWRSVQNLQPDADSVEIEVLRPPSG